MSLEFRSARPEDLSAVRDFLLRIFAAPPDATFARLEHLRWKYFQSPEPVTATPQSAAMVASHSFLYESEGQIAAHVCMWPFQVSLNGIPLDAAHPIDWAASSAVPGAGALLLRQIRELADLTVCVGGTEAALKVIALAGFKPMYTMKYYSRPLRPWRQFLSHQQRNYKLPARLLRNLFWSASAGHTMPEQWTATPVEPEDLPAELLPVSDAQVTACVRNAKLFRHLMDCPIARFSLYRVSRAGQSRGYFLISFVPGQARIADAWVANGKQSDWMALYKLAVGVAYRESESAEIVAGSVMDIGQDALESAGFRPHQMLPVMVFDSKKLLVGAAPIHLQPIDNDFSFLNDGAPRYWT